jgi:acyl-CoA hydrolase/rubrerythrin
MELKGTSTEEVLRKALHKELEVGFRYKYFAEVARRAGMAQAADIFEATARNETEHARHELGFLGTSEDTLKNLEEAILGETREATKFYPEAAEMADTEGFTEIADFFRTMSKVEANHERNFRDLLASIQKGINLEGHTIGHSAVEMAQVMLPGQANPSGFIHGGELMKLMDDAAAVVAARHSEGSVVTGRVEDIKFVNPVHIGDLVIIHGKLTFTSRSSMEVQIEAETESLFNGNIRRRVLAVSALFVMVALDSNGKLRKVPSIKLSTEQEQELFAEGQQRYQSRKKG